MCEGVGGACVGCVTLCIMCLLVDRPTINYLTKRRERNTEIPLTKIAISKPHLFA